MNSSVCPEGGPGAVAQLHPTHRGWRLGALLLSALGLIVLTGNLGQGQLSSDEPVRLAKPWFFSRPIEALGDASAEAALSEAAVLELAVRDYANDDPPDFVRLMESFVADFPESVWGPSLRNNMAKLYLREGYYTRALHHWNAVWEATQGLPP